MFPRLTRSSPVCWKGFCGGLGWGALITPETSPAVCLVYFVLCYQLIVFLLCGDDQPISASSESDLCLLPILKLVSKTESHVLDSLCLKP